MAQQSPEFLYLLQQGQTITLRPSRGGTYTLGRVTTIDSDDLSQPAAQLLITLAHELGHGDDPDGHGKPASRAATDMASAVKIGETNEAVVMIPNVYLVAREEIMSRNFQNYRVAIIAIVFVTANTIALSAEPQAVVGPRIDLSVTPSNSVKVDFEDGAVLRIPKILLDPSVIPADPNKTIKKDLISFAFQYPDMVQTQYPSPFDLIVEMQTNKHVLKPDRFPVHIVWLFHNHDKFNGNWNAITENTWPDWRPARMVHQMQNNVDQDGKAHHIENTKMIISPSKYKGLRIFSFPITDPEYYESSRKIWRENGWDGKEEVSYLEENGSPYELYMLCNPVDSKNSTKCTAYVYMPSNHFQYRMVFPPEAVAYTDDLIRKTNRLIDSWVQK